jgi:hypothetical protein
LWTREPRPDASRKHETAPIGCRHAQGYLPDEGDMAIAADDAGEITGPLD